MGNFRPVRTKCIEAFLKSLGFKLARTSASHDQWTKPGYRTIPIWGSEKKTPALHVKTVSKISGYSMEEIYAWVEKNC